MKGRGDDLVLEGALTDRRIARDRDHTPLVIQVHVLLTFVIITKVLHCRSIGRPNRGTKTT